MSDLLLFPSEVEATEKAILRAAWEAVKSELSAFRNGSNEGRIRLDLPISVGRVRDFELKIRKRAGKK